MSKKIDKKITSGVEQIAQVLNSIRELEINIDTVGGYDDDFWSNHNMYYDLCLQMPFCRYCIFNLDTDTYGCCNFSSLTDLVTESLMHDDVFRALTFLQVIKSKVLEKIEGLKV